MVQETERQFQTESGIPLKGVYTPEDIAHLDYEMDLGLPGEQPYTRGAYPNMYRERPWRIFQLQGYGTPEEERERIMYMIEQGQRAFIMETDMLTTWMGYDVDHPEVLARKDDVGLYGTPIMSLRDYEIILEGIPIEKLYVHPGGGTPMKSPFCHACYFSLAEKRGIPLSQLSGTGQGDFFVEYIANPFKDKFPPRHALRLNCDLIEFCIENLPRWVPVSIAGNNARENGITAVQELGMIMANAIAYIEEMLRRGRLKIDDFARGIGGVNIATGGDFFENIAQLRAARRMWYKLLTERYYAKDPRSLRLRVHALVRGSGYTYQQPLNNIIRGTYEALSAALGGVQSLGVSCYDEAISIPSEEAQLISVRTQQILQLESNVTSVVDPLAGSYYVEWLTNKIEEQAWEYLRKIEKVGGFIAALESGWLLKEAVKGAVERERRTTSGDLKIVGVNQFQMAEEPHKVPPFRPQTGTWEIAMSRLSRLREERDNKQVEQALDQVREACRSGENVMPPLMKAVKAYATGGEIGKLWREEFSTWSPPSLI